MFTYLPELQKVRRISGRAISGSLFGSDFSYEDVVRLQSLVLETEVERLPDAEVAGRNTHVFSALLPLDPTSTYTRVVSYVDAQTCVALRTELLNKDGMVNKELIIAAEDVKPEGNCFVPRAVLARDRDKGSEMRLRIEKIQYDVSLSESFFSGGCTDQGALGTHLALVRPLPHAQRPCSSRSASWNHAGRAPRDRRSAQREAAPRRRSVDRPGAAKATRSAP